VIANVERVANLFVTKTMYAMLLALAVGAARLPFPFLPRHLTVISSLTIGIPAFFLALAPNRRRFRPGFLGRVLRFAVPAGLVAAAATFGAYAVARHQPDVTLLEARTTATAVLFAIGLWVLIILERPMTIPGRTMVATMGGLFAVVLVVPGFRSFFALQMPPIIDVLAAIGVGTLGILVLDLGWRVSAWVQHRAARVRGPAADGQAVAVGEAAPVDPEPPEARDVRP